MQQQFAIAKRICRCGLVPIVEPEVSLDGDHDIETTKEVTRKVWKMQYEVLQQYGVLMEGMLFKTLQSQCRYKMIAHTEDQVHSYLVELTDHGLSRNEVRSGSTYVAVEPGYVEAILAAT